MGQVEKIIDIHPPKMGLIQPSHGALAPFGLRLGLLMHTALANVGMVVSPRFNVLGRQFGAFHVEMKHLPNAPSSPPIKRLPPPHQTITHKRAQARERARASPLHRLRP
jgi:hypothetical protein